MEAVLLVFTGTTSKIVTQLVLNEKAFSPYALALLWIKYFSQITWMLAVAAYYRRNPFLSRQGSRPILLQPNFVLMGLLEVTNCGFGMLGEAILGSGLSAIVWASSLAVTAVLSRYMVKKYISGMKWCCVVVITIGLALSQGDILFPSSSLSTQIKSTKALDSSTLLTGLFWAMVGVLLASVQNVNAQRVQCDRQQLTDVLAFYGLAFTSIYELFFTIPNWPSWVTKNLVMHNVSLWRLGGLIAVYFVVNIIHNIVYWRVVTMQGALAVGLSQAVRTVVLFVVSGVLFCNTQSSQCITTWKSLSAVLVVAGTIFFLLSDYWAKPGGSKNISNGHQNNGHENGHMYPGRNGTENGNWNEKDPNNHGNEPPSPSSPSSPSSPFSVHRDKDKMV